MGARPQRGSHWRIQVLPAATRCRFGASGTYGRNAVRFDAETQGACDAWTHGRNAVRFGAPQGSRPQRGSIYVAQSTELDTSLPPTPSCFGTGTRQGSSVQGRLSGRGFPFATQDLPGKVGTMEFRVGLITTNSRYDGEGCCESDDLPKTANHSHTTVSMKQEHVLCTCTYIEMWYVGVTGWVTYICTSPVHNKISQIMDTAD